ncbi:MAG: molybdopterin biosynthesis protein MoeB [Myxococcaceae bacterium]|nr:molybdopterin biosynthesis protein MoeB [Myxococcaceae bacterium]
MNTMDDLFSRETLAGNNRDVLARAVVVLVGCGAAGNNLAFNLVLSGVGQIRFVDDDWIEVSNLPRAPLFRAERMGSRRRYKAREIALGALAHAYATEPTVRYAITRIEALGLAAFADAHVIVSAVDSFEIRALLSDMASALGIPLVEIGFAAPRGQVSVFPHRTPEEPDWRCLHPEVEPGRYSCDLYARAAAATGRIAATQTVASALASVASEAVIRALHGEFPLGNQVFHLDVRSGRSSVVRVSRDPDCPGVHARLPPPVPVQVAAVEPLGRLLQIVGEVLSDPIVDLPAPFLVQAPCERCGRPVRIERPIWSVEGPPACRRCPEREDEGGGGRVIVNHLDASDPLARLSCRQLGLPAGSIVSCRDRATDALYTVRLAGGVDDLFVTRRRVPSPAATPPDAPALSSEVAP